MSKISEQKALEAYPIKITRSETETSIGEKYDTNYINRQVYIKCYDQAMQDFLEKAYEWILYHFTDSRFYNTHTDEEIKEQFKNYMQNEHGTTTKD